MQAFVMSIDPFYVCDSTFEKSVIKRTHFPRVFIRLSRVNGIKLSKLTYLIDYILYMYIHFVVLA